MCACEAPSTFHLRLARRPPQWPSGHFQKWEFSISPDLFEAASQPSCPLSCIQSIVPPVWLLQTEGLPTLQPEALSLKLTSTDKDNFKYILKVSKKAHMAWQRIWFKKSSFYTHSVIQAMLNTWKSHWYQWVKHAHNFSSETNGISITYNHIAYCQFHSCLNAIQKHTTMF